jgi:ribokinase
MIDATLRAFVLGDVNVDISLAVDDFPSEGGDAQAHDRTLGSGGGGLNAAVALRALGVDVSLVGCVGEDPLSDIAIDTATERGVDLSRLQRTDTIPTGTCVLITTPRGERTLLSHRGANAMLSGSCVDAADFGRARLLLVFGYALLASPQREATLSVIECARQHGCTTAMDVGLAVARHPTLLLDLLPSIDLLMLNELEVLAFTSCVNVEDALDQLLAAGARTIVVKLGSRGCLVADGEGRKHFAGESVRAVDTTACGDAFSAVFAWMRASAKQVADCAQVANLMGAMTACHRGAAESVPSTDRFQNALRTGAKNGR